MLNITDEKEFISEDETEFTECEELLIKSNNRHFDELIQAIKESSKSDVE